MKFSNTATTFSLILFFAMLSGCKTETRQGDSKKEESAHAHPKMSFHKPETLSLAATRLGEIHESLVVSDDFPEPIKVQYVEVIHGEGAAAHSHFYSAAHYDASDSEDEHDDHDEHPEDHEEHDNHEGHDDREEHVEHEEDEKVERHTMEVDLRTELTDIVSWLPDLAAKSDLGESDWNAVSAVSKNLSEIVDAIPSDATDAAFREAWQTKADEAKPLLDKLQSVATASAGDLK